MKVYSIIWKVDLRKLNCSQVQTFSGLLLAAAMSFMGRADVLLANMQWGGITWEQKQDHSSKLQLVLQMLTNQV